MQSRQDTKTRTACLATALLLLALPAIASDARKARDFAYPDVNPASPTHGKTMRLSEIYGDRGVVLNFIASWCPPCWKELPSFQKLAREGTTPVVLVAADEHGPSDDLLALATRAGLNLPILLVPRDDIERMEEFWDHAMLPSTYMIDFQGNIRQALEGMVEEVTLFRAAARSFPGAGVVSPPAPEGSVRQ